MEHDFSIQLTDELLSNVLIETDEWTRICEEDPYIQAQRAALEAVAERVGALIPRELRIELEDTITGEEVAYINAAILYGMRAAGALRDGVNRQIEVSRHILKRTR